MFVRSIYLITAKVIFFLKRNGRKPFKNTPGITTINLVPQRCIQIFLAVLEIFIKPKFSCVDQ